MDPSHDSQKSHERDQHNDLYKRLIAGEIGAAQGNYISSSFVYLPPSLMNPHFSAASTILPDKTDQADSQLLQSMLTYISQKGDKLSNDDPQCIQESRNEVLEHSDERRGTLTDVEPTSKFGSINQDPVNSKPVTKIESKHETRKRKNIDKQPGTSTNQIPCTLTETATIENTDMTSGTHIQEPKQTDITNSNQTKNGISNQTSQTVLHTQNDANAHTQKCPRLEPDLSDTFRKVNHTSSYRQILPSSILPANVFSNFYNKADLSNKLMIANERLLKNSKEKDRARTVRAHMNALYETLLECGVAVKKKTEIEILKAAIVYTRELNVEIKHLQNVIKSIADRDS